MSEPRKHHDVPRFYLARFATRKQQIYQIEKLPTPRVYPISIRDAAAVRDYHRLDWDGVPDPQGLERVLAKVEDYPSELGRASAEPGSGKNGGTERRKDGKTTSALA